MSDPGPLPPDVLATMQAVEQETAPHNRMVVNVCVSYGARASVVGAMQRLFRAGGDTPAALTADALRRELSRSLCDARAAPLRAQDCAVAMDSGRVLDLACDPDVLLRTSREQRLSNFLLLELAYTELFFVDELWPGVSEATLDGLLDAFAHGRQRRFGV